MTHDGWAAITAPDTVVLLAALAVYLGVVTGISKNLPRLLLHDAGW